MKLACRVQGETLCQRYSLARSRVFVKLRGEVERGGDVVGYIRASPLSPYRHRAVTCCTSSVPDNPPMQYIRIDSDMTIPSFEFWPPKRYRHVIDLSSTQDSLLSPEELANTIQAS